MGKVIFLLGSTSLMSASAVTVILRLCVSVWDKMLASLVDFVIRCISLFEGPIFLFTGAITLR